MHRRSVLALAGTLLICGALLPQPLSAQTPPFRDVLSLEGVGAPAIAPDGRTVAYTVRQADWDANGYDTEIWLWREDGTGPFQATRTADGSSTSPAWSPDGRWLAFLADRGHGRQVHVLPADGGEAVAVTGVDGGVQVFRWSPAGQRLAFTRQEPESDSAKAREEEYGRFEVEDADYRMTHLWVVDVDPTADSLPEPRRLTGTGDPGEFTVGSFAWSPDGTRIAFDHQPDPLINSWLRTDVSVVDVASGALTPLVTEPSSQANPIWSPDGRWILVTVSPTDTTRAFFLNTNLARVPATGGTPEILTGDFDEDVSAVAWLPSGVVFTAYRGVKRRPFLLDPDDGAIRELPAAPFSVWALDFTPDGRTVAFTGEDPATLREVFRADTRRWRDTRLTDMTAQIDGWDIGTAEVVHWASRDGTPIEGILRKPSDYDPGRRYPLLVIIHGGPTGISRPTALSTYVYPELQWLHKGALVLEPNYRGSAGYGEAFRKLNVRNLGVGDAWDVLSGVDSLVDAGVADPDSLGAMGWSQGGYISAFLTTNTHRFQAISVGAGISDWVTYYVSTDIHPFTRQYLRATPWEDPEIYAKTSPMTHITEATTPTLIQHGENDPRVPISNAYKLFQGLEDEGVPAKLIVYKGFGHGITRPKELLAATWHNWQWFGHWIWGEDIAIPLDLKSATSSTATDAGGSAGDGGR